MNMAQTDEDDNDNEAYYDYELEYPTDHIMPLKLNESWAARRLMEALSHLPPNSSSAPMRFQQKTHEEKELRRQELSLSTAAPTAAAAAAPRGVSSRLVGNGKVRQMFDERRRGAGIDRSNPLRPIGDTRSQPQQQQQQQQQQLIKGISTMSLKEKAVHPTTQRHGTVTSDSNNNNSKYNASGTVINGNRLKPVVTHKTPPNRDNREHLRSNATPPSSGGSRTTIRVTTKTTSTPTKTTRQAAGRVDAQEKGRPTSPKARQNQPPPEGTSSCRYCGRHFNTDRLGKHEEVCQRTMNTKRKIFDASKQRVKGTDNEKYSKQQQRQRQQPSLPRSQSTYSSAAQQQGLRTGVKKSNWRKQHEEFIQAIRAAKQVQAHLARGGKLSDLPPPPPSENPDYIQCPHCSRRFNQQAAERHIPRCATMIHNKPRRSNPQAVPKKR
ncbi:hypothetical protein KR215_000284 [Drosophila sulfurigaster]|nr:hypothetical protein KR215_000284 [Drosophila sulfurigaster]